MHLSVARRGASSTSASATVAPAQARVTTNIVGGLGNQLFLVSNLLATAHRNNIPAHLETTPLSSSAEAPRPTYWDSMFRDLHQHGVQLHRPGASSLQPLPVVTVPETRPVAKVELVARRPCVYNMCGFFQSEVYFDDHAIIGSVVPAELWSAARAHLAAYYGGGGGGGGHTIALHLRRGDYTRFADVFEQLDVTDYYDVAVQQLLGGLLLLLPAPASPSTPARVRLLIFCEEERVGRTVVGYFAVKYRGAVEAMLVSAMTEADMVAASSSASLLPSSPAMPREVLELLMMALCNDVVMANSTFSWWGAYLNRTPLRRVVAPARWFVKDPYPASNHLYCRGWMLL
ncbi:Glycosyl transferase family 11 [Novymonas esmeraldas]|uniref:Glycosyl transferase family 11 n=1 Tax=Novymonas esmeraldas TaxID=1808958 RepID=A0AAW0ENV4_9TRYP